MRRSKSLILFKVITLMSMLVICGGVDDDTMTECGNSFQKVTACLSYATGKAVIPPKECCGAVDEIKDSDPKCLCFIIQKTHNGSSSTISMGIQESKLLQLPSACQLKNASTSYCPKLLGLSPSSPDAAIFTNASTTTASSPPLTVAQNVPNESAGTMHTVPRLVIGFTICIHASLLVVGFFFTN